MAKQGNRYNEENQSVSTVARDFGINDQTIRNWLKTVEDKKDPENNRIAELEAQLKEERKKSADLQQTVDVLKKSIAIFIQDNRK